METKSFQWRMVGLVFVSFWSLLLVILLMPIYIDQSLTDAPQQVNLISLAIFYLLVFISAGGVFTLFLFWLRKRTRAKNNLKQSAILSLRQGFLLGLLVIIFLIMQSFRVLIWWDALLAIGSTMMIELYFLTREE